jgi:hypothetical protein
MKRVITISITTLLAACLVCSLSWVGFMSYLHSRVSPVTVSVVGSVDKVDIYNVSDPTQAVTTISTNGHDTTADFTLPIAKQGFTLIQLPPSQYFFVTITGEQQYQGPVFCCMVSMFPEHRVLTIRGLSNWEVHSK